MNRSEQYINWLFAHKIWVGLALVFCFTLGVLKLPSLHITGNLSGFNATGNLLFKDAKEFDNLFGGTRNKVFLSITPRPDAGYTSMKECLLIEKEIRALNSTVQIRSPRRAFRTLMLFSNKQDHLNTNEMLRLAARHPNLRKLISNDRNSFLMVLDFPDGRVPTKGLEVLSNKDRKYIQKTHFFGLIPLEEAIEESIRHDILLISLAIAFFFGLYVFWIYRSTSAILYAALSMGASVLLTLCLYPILQLELTVVTVLALPIVLVLSLSDSVHLLSGLIGSANHKSVMAQFIVPSFLSSLTTSVAFFTFYFNDSPSIQQLGLITGIAIMLEFFVSFGIATFCFSYVSVRTVNPVFIRKVSSWIVQYRTAISLALTVVVVSSVFVISALTFDSKTDDFFPENKEITRDHQFLNDHYYAQTSCHVWFENNHQLDEGVFLYQVRKKIALLEKHPSVVEFSSLSDAHVLAENTRPHSSRNTVLHVEFHFKTTKDIISFYQKMKSDKTLKAKNMGIHIYSQFILLDYINRQVAQSLLLSLLTSGAAVILMLLLITRSVKQALVGFIPNIIPLGFAVWLFVLCDFHLNLLTAITCIVCIGLLDDDTIHILYRKYILLKNPEKLNPSILNTAILLAIGFGLFMLSDFYPTRVFGGVSALVFVFGILGELTLFQWILDRVSPQQIEQK